MNVPSPPHLSTPDPLRTNTILFSEGPEPLTNRSSISCRGPSHISVQESVTIQKIHRVRRLASRKKSPLSRHVSSRGASVFLPPEVWVPQRAMGSQHRGTDPPRGRENSAEKNISLTSFTRIPADLLILQTQDPDSRRGRCL